jgi:cytochrome P450
VLRASLVTTANQLTQVLYDILSRPEVLTKVLEEQRAIIASEGCSLLFSPALLACISLSLSSL